MRSVFIVATCFLSVLSSAKNFEYHHASPFALGLGVNLAEPFEPQRMCLDFEEERMDGEIARKSEINIRVVESRKELFRELGMSSSVAAHSYFISGDAGASYLDEANFQEDSLVWLVIGSVDFGRVRAKNAKLKDFASQMLQDSQHSDFRKRCGIHYVSQERRGASVFALYTLRNLNHHEKTDIKAWLNAHTSNIPFVNVETQNKFSYSLSEFARNKQLNFRILALGGKGINALSNIPKYENDINKIKDVISEYLANMTIKNAVPLEFSTSSFEQFGWHPEGPLNWNKRDNILTEYYFVVHELDNERKRLKRIVDTHSVAYPHLSDADVSNFHKLMQERNLAWARLHGEAEECVHDASKCKSPEYHLPLISWPRSVKSLARSSRVWLLHQPQLSSPVAPNMSREECDTERKFALRIGCINADDMAELQMINAAPLCMTNGQLGSLSYCE